MISEQQIRVRKYHLFSNTPLLPRQKILYAGILAYKIIKNGGGLQGILFTAVGKENTEEQLAELIEEQIKRKS